MLSNAATAGIVALCSFVNCSTTNRLCSSITMPTTHVPKYPVVDPSPSMSKAVCNFNFTDYTRVAAFTASGYIFGWMTARKPFRAPQSKFLAVIGLAAGVSYASLSSIQRFMGLEPNSSEVQRYGALTPSQLERREDLLNTPNVQLIDNEAD